MNDKSLTFRRPLFYYDGIQVLEGVDDNGSSYIGVLVEASGNHDVYVVVRISTGSLLRFRHGQMDLRSLLLQEPDGEWYIGNLPDDSEEPMALVSQTGKLADFPRLPEPGFILPQPKEAIARPTLRRDPATEYFKKCLKGGQTPDEAFGDTLSLFGPSDAKTARMNAKAEIHRIYILRDPPILADNDLVKWYTGPTAEDKFWPSLAKFLRTERQWDDNAVEELNQASTQIVSRLSPPGMPQIRTRGLVVGYVQSGKTANFTAVVAKAADVNYRLFVVLSGLTNSLRNQTQQRLDRELVSLAPGGWLTLTTAESDFSGSIPFKADAVLSQGNGPRVLAVLKKNGNRLRRFVQWLEGAHPDIKRNCPILIIDDEADQASINTSKNELERSRINKLIVRLLNNMPKAAYIGYTATPFANVLNEPPGPNSLYPSHFIVTLPRPKTYFGPERIFGRERLDANEEDADIDGLDMVRSIPDEEALTLHGAPGGAAFEVTPSLDSALRYFLMATAARLHREQKIDFSTMMIHTTQRVVGHDVVRQVVAAHGAALSGRIFAGDAAFTAELRSQWESELTRVTSADAGANHSAVTFDDLMSRLPDVMKRTEFIVDNYISPARLDFSQTGRILVVTGGNTLARGLTVEGLVTSYFIRTSTAYDTLMQMGRWFGYRPNYEDLPRIWMTDELRDYFFDLATIEEEFRSEVRRYTLGLTPRQFGPRIRTHPALMITSRLKMQAAIDAYVSYGGMRCQTILFHYRDKKWLQENLDAGRDLIAAAARNTANASAPQEGRLRFIDVPVSDVVAFFERYEFHPDSREMTRELVLKYIRAQNGKKSLLKWNVVVVGQRDETKLGAWDTGLGSIGLINRSRMREASGNNSNTANIKTLMSKADIVADFEAETDVTKSSHEDLLNLRNERLPRQGLLLLYPISKDSVPALKKNGLPNEQRQDLNALEHVLGVAIVLPEAVTDTPQSYKTVNMENSPREEPEYSKLEEKEDSE